MQDRYQTLNDGEFDQRIQLRDRDDGVYWAFADLYARDQEWEGPFPNDAEALDGALWFMTAGPP